jgi:hypothetical protein
MALNMEYTATTTKGTIYPVKIKDSSIKDWGMYHLGIKIREKLLHAKDLAVGNPLQYMQDRTNLIKAADQRIGDLFLKTYKDYEATGIGDNAAKKYALELCKAAEQAEMNLINLRYPDAYKETAEHRQHKINEARALHLP